MTAAPTALTTAITNDRYHTWLRPDGLIQVAWAPGFTIDADLANAVVADGRSLAAGTQRGLLVDMRVSGPMNKDARSIFVKSSEYVFAVALWVQSPLSVVIANFFLGVSRAPTPTRMFTTEADAVRWLIAQRE